MPDQIQPQTPPSEVAPPSAPDNCVKDHSGGQGTGTEKISKQIEEAADTQGGGLIAGGSEEAAAEAKDEAAAWSELILANRVVLHLEVINKKSMKRLNMAMAGAFVLALLVTVFQLVCKLVLSDREFLQFQAIQVVNVAVGGVALLAVVYQLVLVAWRLFQVRGRHWARRHYYLLGVHLVESSILVVLCLLFVALNLFILVTNCQWFTTTTSVLFFFQATCNNTLFMCYVLEAWAVNQRRHPTNAEEGPGSLQFNAPIVHNWWIGMMWTLSEAILLLLAIFLRSGTPVVRQTIPVGAQANCYHHDYHCSQDWVVFGLAIGLFGGCYGVYLVLWSFLTHRAISQLAERRFDTFQSAHIILRMQFRLRVPSFLIYWSTTILLVWWNLASCSVVLLLLQGLPALFIVQAAVIVGKMYFVMPQLPDSIQDHVLEVWLQDFAWTEDELPRRKADRNALIADVQHHSAPMFCYSLAIRLFCWACCVYGYDREHQDHQKGVARMKIDTALHVFPDMSHYEVLYEPAKDTVCLLGWSKNILVLTFRGTASMANVWADLSVWRHTWPPNSKGSSMARTRSAVHSGFLSSWTANGLHERVLQRIRTVLEEGQCDPQHVKILVTGHSLGGAVATLAAFDIARQAQELGIRQEQVACYTFGAPRTGNAAFAEAFNRTVPDTWMIINGQDAVPRSGKFWRLYSRPGHMCLINPQGDLIVRPSFVVRATVKNPFRSSIAEHMTAGYKGSLLAVCLAQLGQKAVPGGMLGLQRLLESPEIQHLFKQGMQGQLAEVEAGRLNNLPVVGAVNAFARAPMRQAGKKLNGDEEVGRPSGISAKQGFVERRQGTMTRDDPVLQEDTQEPPGEEERSGKLHHLHLPKALTRKFAHTHTGHAGGSREAPKGSGPGPPLHQLLQAAAQGPDGPQEASTAEAPPGAIRRRLSNNLQSALRELWEEKRREQAQTRRPQQDSGTDSAAAHPLAESPGNASQPQAGQEEEKQGDAVPEAVRHNRH